MQWQREQAQAQDCRVEFLDEWDEKSATYVSTIYVLLYPSDMYLFQLLVAITFLFSCSRLGLAFGTRDAYHFFIMHSLPGYMLQLLLRNLQKYNRILYFMAVKNLFIMVNYCEMQLCILHVSFIMTCEIPIIIVDVDGGIAALQLSFILQLLQSVLAGMLVQFSIIFFFIYAHFTTCL